MSNLNEYRRLLAALRAHRAAGIADKEVEDELTDAIAGLVARLTVDEVVVLRDEARARAARSQP